jgi:hypothetical protein
VLGAECEADADPGGALRDGLRHRPENADGEAGLRTVPGDELANSVVVGSPAGRCEAVQDNRLGVFEIRGTRIRLGGLFLRNSISASATASFTVADNSIEWPPYGVLQELRLS